MPGATRQAGTPKPRALPAASAWLPGTPRRARSAHVNPPPAADGPTGEEKKQRGQFFTRHTTVHTVMANLISHRTGTACEPSAGAGHLVAVLEAHRPNMAVDAVELDHRLTSTCRTPVTRADFFTWSVGREGRYQLIFGNPPYVAWKHVEQGTAVTAAATKARYSNKTNLYHLFIDRAVDLLADGGEMILIVPKEWLYSTSAAPLRTKLDTHGALTHIVDCGEEPLFADAAVPALLIFRWVKGQRRGPILHAAGTTAAAEGTWTTRQLGSAGQRWLILPTGLAAAIADWTPLSDQYIPRVGLVTGLDRAFRLPAGHRIEPECVHLQIDTSRTPVPFLDVDHITNPDDLPPNAAAHLAAHEHDLRARRIRTFDDSNWWTYGARRNITHMASDTRRFYALVKTRHQAPFFTCPDAGSFTGGVLGLFAHDGTNVDVDTAVAVLNSPAYRAVFDAMSLTTADKLNLQPATLSDAPFPPTAVGAANWLDNAGYSRAPSSA